MYIAEAISGIAHIVALAQTAAFGVFSGRIPSANNNKMELCATRVECLTINC